MKHLIGSLICFLAQSHKWRRLRKGETSYIPAEQVPFDPKAHRTCGRCGIVRAIRERRVME